ncbi:MAG: chromate transporter [Clostridia bacterium]|nr:chromate transporter [Clostridia bacterium]
MKSPKRLWQLFITFFRIGAFTFGGGYAMIPLIQRETVEKHGWISDDDILEIIAIAESTPGPIAINSATFVGFRVGGVLGSACATLGVVFPSFIIISLIAVLLRDFSDLKPVRYAFFGIRAGVLALLLKALWTMFKKCPKKAVSYAIVACAFVLSAIIDLNVLIIIAASAVAGLTASLISERRKDK